MDLPSGYNLVAMAPRQRLVTLDTNVMLEITSPVDLYNKLTPDDDELSSDARQRQRRISYSMALAWQFHRWGMRTVFHDKEVQDKQFELVPPERRGNYAVGVVSLFAHVLLEKVFSGWKWRTSKKELPEHLDGTRVDDALLAYSLKYAVPLITRDGRLTKKALKANARVFLPEEYLRFRHADPKTAIAAFLQHYLEVYEALPLGHERRSMRNYEPELRAILLEHEDPL